MITVHYYVYWSRNSVNIVWNTPSVTIRGELFCVFKEQGQSAMLPLPFNVGSKVQKVPRKSSHCGTVSLLFFYQSSKVSPKISQENPCLWIGFSNWNKVVGGFPEVPGSHNNICCDMREVIIQNQRSRFISGVDFSKPPKLFRPISGAIISSVSLKRRCF